MPFSERVCGLPGALSATWRVAENAPALAGRKLMLTEQFALAASTEAQVLVSEKLEAVGPLMEMELMERFWSPLLTIENTPVALLVPTVAVKFAVDGKIFATGPLTV